MTCPAVGRMKFNRPGFGPEEILGTEFCTTSKYFGNPRTTRTPSVWFAPQVRRTSDILDGASSPIDIAMATAQWDDIDHPRQTAVVVASVKMA